MRSHPLSVVLLVVLTLFVNTTFAQQVNPRTTQPSITVHPTTIKTGTFLGVSPKLRDIKPIKKTGKIIGKDKISAEREREFEFNESLQERNYPYAATAQPQGPDPVWQRHIGTNHVGTRAPILNFAGQSSPYYPSDCNGSVGINYFMQGVNSTYAIYDKNTGTQVIAPTAFNTLFSGVPGATNNDGDIIVLFDDNASRWFAAEFDITDANNLMLIAVSVTDDPTGSWYKWSFDVDDLPDYPKFGIWQDGYYMADNNSTGNDVYVFERSVMLTGGASPQMVAFNNPNRPASGFHCIEPLDNDGTWAPAGTPGQFITINDDAWGGLDELWIYECAVDWVTPTNSTFVRTQTITVPAFDSNFGVGWDNITQPNTQKLDAIPQILMFRAQYRNFGTTQTIVCAHTVDVDNTDHAGIRWYELQNSGSGWSIRQNGTYAPDGDSRWLPSIAMDGQRNISIGYNVSSSTTYPSIRYAAQSAAENALASGTLDIPEENIEVGTQAQTTYNRWGDYAEMSIDPVDDVTFWFTTEYYNAGKKTKIADWRFGVAPLPPNTNFVINTPNTLLRPVPLLTGQSATFTNLTTGQVDNWLWTFQSGTPGTSTAQDPGSITYNTAGLFDVSLYADNVYGDSTLTRTDYIKVIDPTVVTCDTLVQFYGNPVVYRSSGGGYVGGTNEYSCNAIAEKFDNFSPYNKITGGRFYWAQATSGTNPNVTFVLWGDDGSGAPGTQLATKVVPLTDLVNDMATLGYTDIAFAADVPLPSTGAFFLGFEMPGDAASGDTLAVVTNTDSDGPDDTGYSLYTGWETYSAWSMSLMNAIFAYGCYDPYMPPVADFEGVPTTVNAGSTVSFTDLSYGGAVTSWSWDFGGGGTPNTSTAQNPTITYNTPGYYDVTLTVTNAYGSDIETKTNYIHVVDPNSCSCGQLGNVVGSQVLYVTASGYVSGNNEYADEAKAEYFDSYAPYTEINGAYLYFGHVYVANPATNITINIWDNTGTGGSPGAVIATTTVPITTIATDVSNGDSTYVAFPAVGIPGPFYIGFIIPNPASAGDTVALMSGQQNSSATNTAWERWSDGLWYDYASGWGGTWNLSVFPVVCTTGAPLVDFTVNNTLVAAGNTLDFTDLSTCGPTSWSWDFGGGGTPNTSTVQNPSITYNTPGVYDVSLTASNGSGSNTELKTSYITVLEPIVWWDFPNNPDDNTADGGIAANLTKTIDVFGGATLVGFGSPGASTNSADGNNWGTGAGIKGWQVDFTTTGYGSLLLYSKQNSDARGPQDWKVQYSLDGTTWIDLTGATITVATDWTTGVLNGVSLPVACENQATVYLRWIMTSNNGVGGTILSTRDNFIDDIMVAGIAIGSSPVADFSADVTSICEGGTVTFTDLSTNSPTSWSWDFGDATNSTQQNPSHVYATAGTYTVVLTATNAAGSDSETKTNYIIVNPNPTVSTSVTDVSCNGGNDGTATATGAGGTTPYGYLWNTGDNTASISGLTAGTYTVTVTDANTCSGTGSATVSQPATALSANITASTNVSCNGGSDGSATVTAAGGTTPYTYSWPSGGTGTTESGLAAGSYIVTVTDANNCTATATANISEPATALSTTITGTDISCNGGSDGTAAVTASGGTSPYTYLWTGGQTTVSINGLIAGTYSCTITDNNGCNNVETIVITEPSAISTSMAVTDASCNGSSDGSATVTVSGGTSPYTYLWSSGGTGATESGIAAGNYAVTVTDANGCTATDNATIGEPTAIVITETHNDATCGLSDGDATVSVSGGSSPYTYLWSSGQTTASISGLAAGNYTVTVTDTNSCINTLTVSINSIGGPTLTISSTDVSCNGGSDGTASVTASGGTPPYTYLWSGGQITASINTLIAGTYSVTVTDANTCYASASVSVNEPTTITATATILDVNCNGGSDGSISLTVSGGTSPYTYAWSSGGNGATESGLAAGTYDVTITDANLCTYTNSYTVNEPSAIVVTSSTVDVVCNGGNGGSATVSVSGGTSPYTYAWSSGGNGATESGLTAGSYTCTITDAHSCTITENVTINEPSAMVLTMNSTDASCGIANGSADVSVTGGTSPYTYLWSTGGTGISISSLSAGTYTVTVTDANSCQENNSVSIIQTSAVTATATISDVNCNGGNDGSISLTVSGGTSPYSFNWSSGGTTNTETGLVAGTYDVTVTDANLCTYTNSYTVNEPSAIVVTSSTVDALCNGGSDGSATVSVSGGTSPYTYAWSSGGNGATESGLTAGSYTCTITDANSCTATENVTINEPSAMVLTMNSTDASCGSSNGTADVSVTGGNSPYIYLWSNGATTSSISSLAAGSYDVTVTDANSCQEISSVIVNNIGGPTLTISTSDVSCNGGTDGSASVTATGGTTPYIYTWSSGGNSSTETGLSAGNYTVTVTDANTCSSTVNATINEPSAITATGIVTDASCGGCTDGSIDVTVSGGTLPYTYAWSSGGNSSTETGLGAGTYTVTITDDNGCTDIETYTVNEPSSLTITVVSTTDVTCNGGTDGSATISVSGGVSPYTYAWSSGGVGTTETGLGAGTYTVTVTDANSATGIQTITINEPPAIVMTFTINDANCGATDGSADVSVTGGTSPYTYLWSSGSTTSTASNLGAGTYYLTVTDAASCQTVDSVAVGNIGGPTLIITGTDVSCYGLSDGSATVVATGGSTPYTYSWSSGGTSDTETGLAAGTYSVIVTDAGGCLSSESVTINEPTQIVVTDSITDVSCSGNADGSISITVTGGTTPYSYAWSSGGTNSTESGLVGGTYSVTITDNNGCTDIESYTINESAGLTLSLVSSSDVSCNGGNNGSATVSVTGGSTPISYMWTTGNTTATAFNLSAGTYTVTATDANNCIATLDVTINEPVAMTVNITTNNAHCGNNDGSIVVSITGGTTPYTYLWSNGATGDSLSGLAMGIYIVTITDANGCEYVSTNIINNLDAPTVMVTGTDVACFGGDDGTATAMVTGGTTPYSYLWSSGGTASIENGLTAGNYVVTVTDVNNCSSIGTFRIEQPAFGIKISSSVTDASCPEKTDGAIDLDVEFGTPPYNFTWSSGENYEDLTDVVTGSYVVTVTDMHNCSLTDSIVVGTKQSTCLHVYNTITPNGDGKNDTWVIDGIIYYPNCAVKVFNQWGNMVYSSTGYPENWDGTNNGHLLPAATYYYIIDLGNGDDPITGDLTIIRAVGNRMPVGPNFKKKKPEPKNTNNQDSAENLINE